MAEKQEQPIGRFVGDKIEVDDKEGRTWCFDLLVQEVLADVEKWFDRQRQNRLFEFAKESNVPPNIMTAMLTSQGMQPVTLEMVFDAMQSPSGMEYTLWRCMRTHHANINRADVSRKWNFKERIKIMSELVEASGFGKDDDDDADPTQSQPEIELHGDKPSA